jgi:hypothetical protein
MSCDSIGKNPMDDPRLIPPNNDQTEDQIPALAELAILQAVASTKAAG